MNPNPARPLTGRSNLMTASALALGVVCLAAPVAAQTAPGQSAPGQNWSEPGYNGFSMDDTQMGVTIQVQIDVVFQPALGERVSVLQNQFTTGAMGVNATTEYIFEILNQAALGGLQEALMRGAQSGRVTVVATGCEVGLAGHVLRSYAPVGVFINTTDMRVGADGKARFHTRVKFIPDGAAQIAPPLSGDGY
jgi:hypothetical protein